MIVSANRSVLAPFVGKLTYAFKNVHTEATNYISYRNTLTRLKELPPSVRMDLDIQPHEMKAIAHRAVYGS